jgi:hypothetical protein
MARQKKTDRLDDRLVILVESGFKTEVQGMYQDIGLNISDDTRDFWRQKLDLYKASKNES